MVGFINTTAYFSQEKKKGDNLLSWRLAGATMRLLTQKLKKKKKIRMQMYHKHKRGMLRSRSTDVGRMYFSIAICNCLRAISKRDWKFSLIRRNLI